MFSCVSVDVHSRLEECVVEREDECEVELLGLDVPLGECAALPSEEFSDHASSLNHPLQCPLPGSDRVGSRDHLPFETCYYYHPQRGGSPPSPALILISTETRGESGPFVPEVFIHARDLPKNMETTLLQVMTVEPQHMIHFLSFNLIVSSRKFF